MFSWASPAKQDAPAAYSSMPLRSLSSDAEKAMRENNQPDGFTAAMGGLAMSESMDMTNDPRLFGSNVLMKRLLAFSALALVSSIMVKTTQAQLLKLKKDMDLTTADGLIQFTSFVLMNFALFINMLAMYIGVAQQYFTYRLMTAGPTGYEMASAYYLNPNIAFWRHAAIKGMLSALPLFLISTSLKLLVMFDKDMPNPPEEHPDSNSWALARLGSLSVLGLVVCVFWVSMAVGLCFVDSRHRAIFREKYDVAKELERPLLTHVGSMSSSGSRPEV
eukprot:TRINITY_DN3729_c0_g1_i3.p1 TRINITY_DN3729_c0_g1~~TRINITY_DN3729_c0_g1_i3.p1  ORF type:complete len:276 (+),score=56.83 TRINITY_DN3729_c0_g1_i3:68-895(+)